MATEEIIFKHPPATEVQIVAGFHNIFAVADHRSRFHKLVYDKFPAIVMPEGQGPSGFRRLHFARKRWSYQLESA